MIHDPGYLSHPDQVELLDGAAEALKELQLLGYKAVVVSNQSGVARGMITEETLERIHGRLEELLAQKGASLDRIYYCPYHPDGAIARYRKDSDWRKPEPGMLLAAAKELDLDLAKSWMVGDSNRDIEAGRSAGCATILIRSTQAGREEAEETRPDHVAVNIREAINIIKKNHRANQKSRAEALPITEDEGAPVARFPQNAAPERKDRPASPQAQAPSVPAEPAVSGPDVEELLSSILEQLKRMQKSEMFGEFSLLRLLAGVVQVFVPFCLLVALWLLISSDYQNGGILVALGFAAVLQLMALTFYLMRGPR
ncbi:MAG: HAD family hydrolase [Sedimentisphaerales bacterium]|nr:HAD family hydrolase [Sedimentisphaerales bacterium]